VSREVGHKLIDHSAHGLVDLAPLAHLRKKAQNLPMVMTKERDLLQLGHAQQP
jgi:hypothetical protein